MRSIFSALALVALTACVNGPTGPDAASRFDRFEAVGTKDFTGYDKVYIPAPVASEELQARTEIFSSNLRRDDRPIAQRDIDAKLSDLHDDLKRAVSKQATLVSAPGEGVLTIITTVTRLESNRPTQAELTRNPALSFQSFSVGAGAVDYELSENGRVLATISDTDNAPPLGAGNDGNQGIWQTVDQFFGQSSRRIADLLTG